MNLFCISRLISIYKISRFRTCLWGSFFSMFERSLQLFPIRWPRRWRLLHRGRHSRRKCHGACNHVIKTNNIKVTMTLIEVKLCRNTDTLLWILLAYLMEGISMMTGLYAVIRVSKKQE